MSERKKYDSTVARIAGNIMSGNMKVDPARRQESIVMAVAMARAIVAETQRTEPEPTP